MRGVGGDGGGLRSNCRDKRFVSLPPKNVHVVRSSSAFVCSCPIYPNPNLKPFPNNAPRIYLPPALGLPFPSAYRGEGCGCGGGGRAARTTIARVKSCASHLCSAHARPPALIKSLGIFACIPMAMDGWMA